MQLNMRALRQTILFSLYFGEQIMVSIDECSYYHILNLELMHLQYHTFMLCRQVLC